MALRVAEGGREECLPIAALLVPDLDEEHLQFDRILVDLCEDSHPCKALFSSDDIEHLFAFKPYYVSTVGWEILFFSLVPLSIQNVPFFYFPWSHFIDEMSHFFIKKN